MEPRDLVLVSALPFSSSEPWGDHRKVMKGNESQQKDGALPAFIWLLEFTQSIHSILSISPPLPGPWQGKEYRKPGSSKFQLLAPSLAPALGLCISYHNNNAVKQPSPNSAASSNKHLFSHLWAAGRHGYPDLEWTQLGALLQMEG